MNNHLMRKMVLLVLLLLVAGLLAFYFLKPKAALSPAVSIDTRNQPSIGNENAKIHIVTFEDLKCGNCMRFNTQIYPLIKKEWIDTGKAKYTMINLAFIPGSLPAANAARCIYTQNPKAFFDFVDHVYNNQPPEDQDWATIPTLMQMASLIHGIDKSQLSTCLVQNTNAEIINQNLKLAEKVMGKAVSTPSVYVNGILVQPLSYEQIQKVIQAVK